MTKLYSALVAILLMTALASAEGTRTWEQTKYDDFEKGASRGVAIRSDGSLELAPAFKPLYTTPSTYIWAITADKQGNLYAAAGAPARVYLVTPDGQTSIIFAPQELQVQALVVDDKGAIYAATSPDGKVYKLERKPGTTATKAASAAALEPQEKLPVAVDAAWTAAVFFQPQTKYIWDLALDAQGRLYVATGDHGEIFRVEKNGQSSVFFKSDEAHIRVLALDRQGNLIAGSDGSGLVYRISPQGEGFVLYSAPKKEITALALDAEGNIYAAGVGEKRSAATPLMPGVAPVFTAPPQGAAGTITLPGAAVPITMPAFPMPGLGAVGGSEVYQIAPDGSPKRIWSSRDDVVYALAFDQQGRLLAGTGNKGRIFAIRSDGSFTDLLKASATQVTAFAAAPGGGLYAATSNLGKLFLLGGAPLAEGSYESDVFDARIFSRWGRAEVRGAGDFDLYARSGNVDNPDRNWSPWQKLDLRNGAEVQAPAARFVQWKAVLRPGNPAAKIDSVVLNYLPKNVAPQVDDIAVQPGARFQPMLKSSGPEPVAINVNVPGQPAPPAPRFEMAPSATRDRDSIAVRWSAHDDNDDDLIYALYYRGDGETRWKLLKDNLTDKFYSFDSALLPDGGYTLKVVASDSSSHSPEEALTAEKESAHFEVDTTPPRIDDLNGSVEGGELRITFRASDNFSVIKRAEYSVDAGEWHFVEPIGRLSDAKTENYDFAIATPMTDTGTKTAAAEADPAPAKKGAKETAVAPAPAVARGTGQEHVIVVRVYDRFDNMGAAKTVIHTK
jgi:sugar lactone lactonase YvrE